MPSFNWFDVFLCFVMLGSIVGGLRSGLARVVVGLAATVVGIFAGFWFYRLVAIELMPILKNNVDAANLLGFLIIFIGVLLFGALISALLSRLFQWIGLSWFNHALGGIAGILRGVLVVTVLVDVLIAFTPPPPPEFLHESRVLPYTGEVAGWLIDIAPRELKDSFEQQLDTLRHFWTPPPKHVSGEQV